MLLRRITKHVTDQNWFAVFIDFLIVVVGILIAFQITNWSEERQEKDSERNYLERLHSDIEELIERREGYTFNRPIMAVALGAVTQFMNGGQDDLTLATAEIRKVFDERATDERVESSVCNMIDWSAAMTRPPTDLPTALELLSAGRVNEISSVNVRSNLLSFTQEVGRSQDLIAAVQNQTEQPSNNFPELFTIRYDAKFRPNGLPRPNYICHYTQMKENAAFLNMLSKNNINFYQYVFKGVMPVSEKLEVLHESVDKVLRIDHSAEEAK